VTDSPFFGELKSELEQTARDYQSQQSTKLFAFDRVPKLELNRKSYSSFVEKRCNFVPPTKSVLWDACSLAIEHPSASQ
jgi:hypothetical protein